ncbi:MAG: hypothetical protein IJD28_07255 [Deferribacterales bacterium]|nr:hypothetical protein [Deferribacterales bacterium]
MKILFYTILAITAIGFIVKITASQETALIPQGSGLTDIIKGVAHLDSNSIFALGAYISAMFPFILSAMICVGYIFEKKYKGAALWGLLIIALTAAFIIKS